MMSDALTGGAPHGVRSQERQHEHALHTGTHVKRDHVRAVAENGQHSAGQK